jgi:hypothetical protein
MPANSLVEYIHNLYLMLEKRQIDAILESFSENSVLKWGPFEYKGKQEIKKWVEEFLDLFTSMHIVERAININADTVHHNFLIEVITLDKKRGIMPVSGIYTFEGDRFQRFDLTPQDSILYLDSRLYTGLKF